jgi:two-component system, OmpR family, response regulator
MERKATSIVVVEDDITYGAILKHILTSRGYNTTILESGNRLFHRLEKIGVPDLFILDYFLGDNELSGLDICRQIKNYFQRPVIMLTSKEDEDTLVTCLESGAQQYLIKPCTSRELVARIEATLRDCGHFQKHVNKPFHLHIDEKLSISRRDSAIVHANGKSIAVSELELIAMELIAHHPEKYLDRRNAFQALYGKEMPPANRSVDVVVSKLRKKLAALDRTYRLRNRRGHGYFLHKTLHSSL